MSVVSQAVRPGLRIERPTATTNAQGTFAVVFDPPFAARPMEVGCKALVDDVDARVLSLTPNGCTVQTFRTAIGVQALGGQAVVRNAVPNTPFEAVFAE